MDAPNFAVLIAVLALLLTMVPLWCEAIECYNCIARHPDPCEEIWTMQCPTGEICIEMNFLEVNGKEKYAARNCFKNITCDEIIKHVEDPTHRRRYIEDLYDPMGFAKQLFKTDKTSLTQCQFCDRSRCNRGEGTQRSLATKASVINMTSMLIFDIVRKFLL